MNFVIGLCGLPILIQTLYPYTYEMCRSYLLPNAQPVEVICTSQAEIDQEMALAVELALPRDQHEFYLVGRNCNSACGSGIACWYMGWRYHLWMSGTCCWVKAA